MLGAGESPRERWGLPSVTLATILKGPHRRFRKGVSTWGRRCRDAEEKHGLSSQGLSGFLGIWKRYFVKLGL